MPANQLNWGDLTMKRTLAGMMVALPLLLAAGYGCQPGSNTTVDMSSAPTPDLAQGALKILSLGTNVNSLTQGGTVRVTAVVTHTDGLQKLLGGQLNSTDGSVKYGAFVAGAGGAYSLDLTWDQLHQAQAISFDQQQQRSFVAEFYDTDGNKVTGNLDLTLTCNGDTACGGKCMKAGSLCSGSSTMICVAGACADGCFIGGALRTPNSTNPDATYGTCQKCDMVSSRTAWTNAAVDTSCGNGMACVTGGFCSKKFTPASAGTSTFNDVWGSGANDVWAVGAASMAYRSTDGGKTWVTTSAIGGPAATRQAVWGPAANNVFIAGSNGTVVQTTNSGGNWTVLASPTSQTLYGIWGSAANDIYVVGGGGTIARSTTTGATWMIQTSGTTNILRTVWGSAANNVFVVGDGGTILRSTDSGATWVKAQTNTTNGLYSIRGVAANDYYAVGSTGTVLRSTDGTTWNKLNFPDTTYTIYDVWGSGANDVYVSTGITIYYTKDSGQTWQRMSTSSQPYYYGIWGSGANDIYAVGSSGAIYHYP